MENNTPLPEGKPVEKPNTIASLVITCDVSNGKMTVAGHVDNTPLVLRMCVEAAHLIMERNAAKDNVMTERNNPQPQTFPQEVVH